MKLGTGVFRNCIAALLFSGILLVPGAQASFRNDLGAHIFQYASEKAPTLYLSNKSIIETQSFLTKAELYFESGPRGAWTLDPDPIRYHFFLDDQKRTRVWAGRDHPLHLLEDRWIEPTSALGSVWVQNQLDALNPRVNGWVGAGVVHSFDENWKLVFTYSPLFLPTFGPSLGFSERGDLNPARFARLPPESVVTGGVALPIRYQLQVGQLSELLLRHQVFLGSSFSNQSTSLDFFAFTAPRPSAVPLTDATLAVGQTSVNANVRINPQFPREYWSGVRIQRKDIEFKPSLELLQNLEDYSHHLISLTGYFRAPSLAPGVTNLSPRASFGILTHLQKQFEAPQFSDLLLFLRVPFELTARLISRTILQSTLLPSKRSLYLMNELEYSIQTDFSILAALRVLAGEDASYFGAWRNQSSVSIGVKKLW
ncbi:MAG: hypothetical protein KGP28_08570 [Bdellovibrionales bacterium]|nr:hypothetical protein [Bdellovibrionales bacterium]